MFNIRMKLATRLSTFAVLAIAIATPACGVELEDFVDNGDDAADDDETEDESGGEEDEEDAEDDGKGPGPSPGGMPTPDPEPGSDDEPASDSNGEGGEVEDDACMAYCDTELSCDDYYPSVVECVASCNETTQETGECAGAFGEMNFCLAGLDCDDFGAFWAGFGALTEGTDPGDFPCRSALIDWATCLSEQGE